MPDSFDLRLGDALGGAVKPDDPNAPKPDKMPSLSEDNLRSAVGNVSDYMTDRVGRDRDMKAQASMRFTTDHTSGTSTITAPTDYIQKRMEMANRYEAIAQIHSDQQNQLRARAEYQRKHPFGNALAQLGASLAANDKNSITRGIGQAAQKLNPTADELRERAGQEGDQALKTYEAADRAYGGLQQERDAARREARLEDQQIAQTQHQRRAEVGSFVERTIARAQTNRQFTDDDAKTFIANGKEMFPWVGEQELATAADRAKRIAIDSEVKKRSDEAREDQRDMNKANLAMKTRLASVQAETEKGLVLGAQRFKAEVERQAAKVKADAEKKGEKIPGDASKAMTTMYVVKKNVEDLRQLIKQYPDKFGMLNGALTFVGSKFNEDDARIASAAQHLFAQLAKGYGGARGFAKVEQPVFRDLAGGIYRSPEANEGDLKSIDAWVDANTKAWAVSLPPNALQKYQELFGGGGASVTGGGPRVMKTKIVNGRIVEAD